MPDRQPKATIIIPSYNEEKGIEELISKLREVQNDYDILFINDGSSDRTGEIIEKAGFDVIHNPYNKGYGAAIKTGIRLAKTDVLVIMDSDGQHNPSEIKKLAEQIGKFDMVVGERDDMSYVPFWRRPLKKILGMIANYLAETNIPDLNSGFRAFKKKIVRKYMHILPNGFSFTTTITLAMLKGGYNVKYLPIRTNKRVGRKSNVGFFKDGTRTILIIIRAIALFNPLKVFIPISVVLFIFGFFFVIHGFFVYHRASHIGFSAILSAMMIFFFGILADQISLLRREGRE